MKNSFAKQNYLAFTGSFKRIDLRFFLILSLDILFYFIFVQLGNLFIKALERKAADVDLAQNFLGLNQQAAASLLSSVRGFFFYMIFLAILFLILIVIAWSIFKGMIWSVTAGKKFGLEFFKKFLLLNLIWLPAWFLLLLLAAIAIKPATAAIYLIVLSATAFYLTNILYPLFLKESRLNKIKEAFKIGIKKLHHFIIPYAVIVFLGYAISKAYGLIALNLSWYV